MGKTTTLQTKAKQKLNDVSFSKLTLPEMLKGLLYPKKKKVTTRNLKITKEKSSLIKISTQ